MSEEGEDHVKKGKAIWEVKSVQGPAVKFG